MGGHEGHMPPPPPLDPPLQVNDADERSQKFVM